jgi:hypothetical protein
MLRCWISGRLGALLGAVLACALTCLAMPAGAADTLRLTVPPVKFDERPELLYFSRLLELALRKTAAEYGPYAISYYSEIMSPQRSIEELKKKEGLVNLIWTGSSRQREEELLPVRISLLGELNNYRLLLIRKGEQERFSNVKTLDDLKRMRAGAGLQWPDTDIMRANGLTVETSQRDWLLFRMLDAHRFDFSPRGLYEVFSEVEVPDNANLAVEKTIMLYYEVPFYFFVNRTNRLLAQRIERGLKMAIADGSFEQLMLSVPNFKRGLEEQRRPGRKLFVLPTGGPAAPVARR